MSERLKDADRAVDEQKRRARRRLVGAVVLAASAAVIVPMLLEKEPQPLGEDVSVQIPPVDEGKFVNRLTRGKGDMPAKADAKAVPAPKAEAPKADAAKAQMSNVEPAATKSAAEASPAPDVSAQAPVAPAKSIGQAEQRMLTPAPPKSSPPADAKPSAPAEAKSSAPAEAKPSPPAEAKPNALAKTVPAPVAASPAPTSPAAPPTDAKAAPSGGFAVQLAAFSDDKGANALANKLKKAGYASAHVETVDAKGGKLWRVRVGGFATRAEAEAARVKLKNEGFSGIVAPAR